MNGKGGERNIKIKIVLMMIIICTIIFVISVAIFTKELLEYTETSEKNIQLIEEVVCETNDKVITSIDWAKLKDINKDIVGWIKIKSTNINYPILKDNDNLKYLTRSFEGNYNQNGAIFTLNENPFEDEITTVYGHNMKNNIMFSELSKYMKKEFFYENSTFYIYTEHQNYKATVFSCYSIGVKQEENNIKLLDFDEEIEYYKNASVHSVEDIGEIKKILKLSTCSYLNNTTTPTNQRYYIVAKLEKAD